MFDAQIRAHRGACSPRLRARASPPRDASVKTTARREANRERWRLFETPGWYPKEKMNERQFAGCSLQLDSPRLLLNCTDAGKSARILCSFLESVSIGSRPKRPPTLVALEFHHSTAQQTAERTGLRRRS